jgi:hypothetical protein
MVVGKWIPTDVVAKDNIDCHQRRSPPTAIPVITTAWTPCPGVVVINPSAVVIRSPTPGFIANPRPAVRWTPHPIPITVRGPTVVAVDEGRMRTPDPTILIRVRPLTIRVEIFAAPDKLVVVLSVVSQTFRKKVFTIENPFVPVIISAGY